MTRTPLDHLAELESMSSWVQPPGSPYPDSDRTEGVEAAALGRLGQLLARKWQLQKLIGLGGMGAVYEARHRTGRRVAIKVMHHHLIGDRKLQKRFIREAYVVNALDHPAVVPVHDADVDDAGVPFLVMDLLEGQTLEAIRVARGGALPAALVLDIAERLLDTLAVAHEHGIVHRDIKPANLLLTTRGELKVLDFGIAASRDRSAALGTHTRSGSLLGTPAFASPEQARGRFDEVDPQSDIWSVGATLFMLVTGETVHLADNANELWGQAMSASARSLRSVAPDAPAALVAAVDGALRYDKRDRWASAKEMRAAVLHGVASSSTDEASHAKTSDAERSRRAAPTRRELGRPSAFTLISARTLASVAHWTSHGRVSSRWLMTSLAIVAGAGAWLLSGSSARDGAAAGRTDGAPKDISTSTSTAVLVAPAASRPELALEHHVRPANVRVEGEGERMERRFQESPRRDARLEVPPPAAASSSSRGAATAETAKPRSSVAPASPAPDTARPSESANSDLLDLWH